MSRATRAPGPVEESWVDAFRRRRTLEPEIREAVLRSLGSPPDDGAHPTRVQRRAGERVDPPAELVLEDGTSLGEVTRLPPELPHGYHGLHRDAGSQLLIVGPGRAVPLGPPAWGWSAQLYATRSMRSWGIGDLADLAALLRWADGLGAAAIAVNPLNAPNPGPDPDPSPYFPSSRRFLDPIYLRIEEIPAAERVIPDLANLSAEGRRLNDRRAIDRPRARDLKLTALERIWRAGGSDEADKMTAFRAERGTPLRRWAIFSALGERHGPDWRRWPEPLRRPDSPAVEQAARSDSGRIAFHEWLQWLLDRQLATAVGARARLITDLPVGFDPGGFDAWDWQDELAPDATVGAPPDRFNPAGQDWGLPPFIPHRLAAVGFRPFVETVRAAMRHAGGLRIDHILGLFRTWWIPRENEAARGAYVRQPVDALLAILALESERAECLVIGEDLGTIGAGVRRRLASHGILSTRVAYFERRLDRIPRLAVATVSNHDLPTIAGAWTGADTTELVRRGILHDPGSEAGLPRKLRNLSGLSADAAADDVILAVHAALSASPAGLVLGSLEDAQRVVERPNVPGTTPVQRPNWSTALPLPIEAMRADPFPERLAALLRAGRSEGALADDPRDVDATNGAQDREL